MRRSYVIALCVLSFAGVAYATGQIGVTGYPPVPRVLKGGTGINIGGDGTISATGEAVVTGAQPFENLSSALRGKYLGASGTAVNAGAYKGNSAPTATEFGYLSGVKSPVQGQISSANVRIDALNSTVITTSTIGNQTVAAATGNAGTATKLETARNINGVAFDGTAPITVRDAGYLNYSGHDHVTPALVNAAAATPADSDSFSFFNSVLKKVSWSGIKSTLKTYFDTLYHGLTVTWSEITGKPTFATVATSGLYSDLSGKPAPYTLPTATPTTLGGVKIDNSSIQIDGSGVIHSTVSSGVSSVQGYTGDITLQLNDFPDIVSEFGTKAPLESPELTGTPTAPTAGLGTSTEQLATTAFVQNALSPITYSPASPLTVVNGTLIAGAYTDLAAPGGTDVNVQELNGTNPLTVQINFSGIASINNVHLYGMYSGGSAHQVAVEIYNYTTASYDLIDYWTTATSKKWYSYQIVNGTDYVSGGAARIQFRHDGSGIAGHHLYLDVVHLRKDSASGGGVTEHNALGGRNVAGSHPADAVSNTPAGTVAATDVQAAINELDTEKAPKASPTFTGTVTAPAYNSSASDGGYLLNVRNTVSPTFTPAEGDMYTDSAGKIWLYISGQWVDKTYVLPAATADTLGGVKVGSKLSITNGVLDVVVASLGPTGLVTAGLNGNQTIRKGFAYIAQGNFRATFANISSGISTYASFGNYSGRLIPPAGGKFKWANPVTLANYTTGGGYSVKIPPNTSVTVQSLGDGTYHATATRNLQKTGMDEYYVAPPTYLLGPEGFNAGTEPAGWTHTGTVAYNYTPAIDGAYSLGMTGGNTVHADKTFTGTDTAYATVAFKPTGYNTVNASIIGFGSNYSLEYRSTGTFSCKATGGTQTYGGSSTAGALMYLKIKAVKGTGTDGVFTAWQSGDGTTWTQICTVTNATTTAQPNSLSLYGLFTNTGVYDQVKVSAADISDAR